jgi:CelD/BcsL family acetyltransferase involved in cellulose biosynthesis
MLEGMSARRAPSGLGASGRALWRDINREYGLAPHESAILVQVCRTVDRLDAIEAELATAPLVVPGSTGQPVRHPLLAEQRMQARVLESLSRALSIPLPGEDVGRRRSPSARENAVQRWRAGGVA